jgi:hypothetical protein
MSEKVNSVKESVGGWRGKETALLGEEPWSSLHIQVKVAHWNQINIVWEREEREREFECI